MLLTITSIRLRSPLKLFQLYGYAFQIMNQLKSSACVAYKTKGLWTTHYTMTLWRNAADQKQFVQGPEHAHAMRLSGQLASEIRTWRMEAERMPSWREAKTILNTKGKRISYHK